MKGIPVLNINHIYLYPAALVVPNEPREIHTVLGSCVAICLYDRKLKRGGMNHFMLPFWNGHGLASPKYGNIAIERLVQKLLNTGANKKSLIAKVFGGGEVIGTGNSQFNIGSRNIETALELLHDYRIPVTAQSTGGKLGRKIIFHTGTGEVIQRFIKPLSDQKQTAL